MSNDNQYEKVVKMGLIDEEKRKKGEKKDNIKKVSNLWSKDQGACWRKNLISSLWSLNGRYVKIYDGKIGMKNMVYLLVRAKIVVIDNSARNVNRKRINQ